MISLISVLLALSSILLALGAFVLLARPEQVLGWLAILGSLREVWLSGRLSEEEEDRLMAMAHRLQGPALVLLFSWSFFCGAVLALVRL